MLSGTTTCSPSVLLLMMVAMGGVLLLLMEWPLCLSWVWMWVFVPVCEPYYNINPVQDFFNEAVNFSANIDFSESQVVETVRWVSLD